MHVNGSIFTLKKFKNKETKNNSCRASKLNYILLIKVNACKHCKLKRVKNIVKFEEGYRRFK